MIVSTSTTNEGDAMPAWETYLAEHRSRFLNEYFDLLRIPSISALPENAGDVQRAAEWVANRLRAAGIERVEIMPTGGHPVVYGEWLHAPGKPTALLYGHFDVQPVDPIQLWTTPPFEPTIRDGRVYARGASDMKGSLLTTIAGVEALLKTTGRLPINVKFFFEGQEEIGSPQVPTFLAANRSRFACDFAISADGGQHSDDEPSLLAGTRGLGGLEIEVRGPKSDLHSGTYGGAVQNPIHALVALLASMRGNDGRILVDGFYDDVVRLTPEDRARIAAVPFDEAALKRELGINDFFGEPGYTPVERTWIRPTLEINGIWGGFQGNGSKTVLPSDAHVKITCRLVPNQDPHKIVQQVKAHVERHLLPGVTATVSNLASEAKPYLVPADHPANQAVRDVLLELYGREPYYERSGGSIPVTGLFLDTLGAYTVGLGFGLDDEGIHAPNEFTRLHNFDRGQKAYCLLLERLGR
jgi:acetylornithine deacetylase/succinyl-diaminopimelate desuccinylase-like protein